MGGVRLQMLMYALSAGLISHVGGTAVISTGSSLSAATPTGDTRGSTNGKTRERSKS